MESPVREITYRDAIREALLEEMERQPGMIIIGEDILPGGGTFGVHQGMGERFAGRMFEAPISEAAIVGAALGAALTGGPAVRLTGPGIRGTATLAPAGLRPSFWREVAANNARYPLGVDCLLVAGAEVIGLPRSTIVGPAGEDG